MRKWDLQSTSSLPKCLHLGLGIQSRNLELHLELPCERHELYLGHHPLPPRHICTKQVGLEPDTPTMWRSQVVAQHVTPQYMTSINPSILLHILGCMTSQVQRFYLLIIHFYFIVITWCSYMYKPVLLRYPLSPGKLFPSIFCNPRLSVHRIIWGLLL